VAAARRADPVAEAALAVDDERQVLRHKRSFADLVLEQLHDAGDKEPAEIWPAYGKVWPVARMMPAAVKVQFVCGYGAGFANVPALMQAAMLLLIGHWYMNREAVVPGVMMELPLGVKNIFEQLSVGDDFADYDSLGPAGGSPMEAATYGRWY
jgi:hypothetical protein